MDTLAVSPPTDTSSVSINFDSKDTSTLNAALTSIESDNENLFKFDFGVLKSQGDILSSLIGSRLEITTSNDDSTAIETSERILMSIDKTTKKVNKDAPVEHVYSHISTLDPLTFIVTSIPLSSVKSFKIVDQYLQEQLMSALSKSMSNKKPKPNPTGKTRINISTKRAGNGNEGKFSVGYVGKMKEWRCSYRMNIPKEVRPIEERKMEGAKRRPYKT